MLSFILGSPAAGKTEHMISRVRSDIWSDRQVLYIVPEQNVLSFERRIVDAMPATDSLFNLEIVSFRRLCNTVFRTVGGLCYNYLDKSGQAILMWRVLSELSPVLNTYKPGNNTDTGLISSLIQLYDEFYDYKVTPLDFENAVYSLPELMRPKAEDIATVFTRYDELVHDGYDSIKDDLSRVARYIKDHSLFSGASVYIDGFNGFTPCEYEVIEALIKNAENVYISLCMNPARDSGIFENILDVKRKLTSVAEAMDVEVSDDTLLSAERSHVHSIIDERIYDDTDSKEAVAGVPDNISLLSCSDIYTECELVAADIMKQVRQGCRWRDLCIIMSSPAEYDGIINSVLSRHEIPFHFNSDANVINKPIFKHIISALDIITYNWQLRDVIPYLKTGVCNISNEDCDIIEEYASTWSLGGSVWKLETPWSMNPSGYTSRIDEATALRLDKINEIRDSIREPILELASTLDAKTSVYDASVAIYRFMCQTIDTDRLCDEDTACYNALIGVLEQMATCGGELPMGDTESFKRVLKMLATMTDINIIPSTIDEVSCIGIGSLRDSGYKKCYILGAVENNYPSVFEGNGIIDDEMRRALTEADIALPHDPEEMYTEQLWLFWRSLLSADSILITRYNNTLSAGSVIPSPCVYELRRLFSDIGEYDESYYSLYDRVYDLTSCLDMLAGNDEGVKAALYEILCGEEKYSSLLEAMKIPVDTGICALREPCNLELFAGDINLTQTRIDSFINCKFAYHLEHILKLNEQRKVTYDPRDVGTFIHALLEEYFRRFGEAVRRGEKLSRDDIEKTVDDIVSVYRKDTCGDDSFISKRLEALFARLKRTGVLFVKSIYDEFENSDFSPVLFEVSISDNDDKGISPFRVQLSDGSYVYIYGQIDRVDTYEKDGCVYVRVVDYKTGKKEFRRDELEKGMNLQMFLYMLSIMENGEKFCAMTGQKGRVVPAGVLYYIARLPSEASYGILSDKELENKLIDRMERQGLVLDDPEIIDAMSRDRSYVSLPDGIAPKPGSRKARPVYTPEGFDDIKQSISETLKKIAAQLKSGQADALVSADNEDNCRYCRMKAVCRKQSMEVDHG